MPDSFAYSPVTVERARKIYELFAKRVVNGILTPMTYKEAGGQVGAHQRAMGAVLHKIQDECRDRGLPTITILIVDQKTGLPNSGCDVTGKVDVEQEMPRLLKAAWPEKAWW